MSFAELGFARAEALSTPVGMVGLQVKGALFAHVATVALHLGFTHALGRVLVANLLGGSGGVAGALLALGVRVGTGCALVAGTPLHTLLAAEVKKKYTLRIYVKMRQSLLFHSIPSFGHKTGERIQQK